MVAATCLAFRSTQAKPGILLTNCPQALAVVCLIAWSLVSTYVLLRSIDFFLPFRAGSSSCVRCSSRNQHITGETETKLEGIVEELLGADLMEHNILHKGIGVTETLETLARSAFGQMSYFFVFSI